jgi:hypothetical protein
MGKGGYLGKRVKAHRRGLEYLGNTLGINGVNVNGTLPDGWGAAIVNVCKGVY